MLSKLTRSDKPKLVLNVRSETRKKSMDSIMGISFSCSRVSELSFLLFLPSESHCFTLNLRQIREFKKGYPNLKTQNIYIKKYFNSYESQKILNSNSETLNFNNSIYFIYVSLGFLKI